MVGRPESDLQAQYKFRSTKDHLELKAKNLYITDRTRTLLKDEKPLSLRAICTMVSDSHYAEKKERIELSSSTLKRHIDGGTTMSDFNATKLMLDPVEEQTLEDYCVDMAGRGFPLSPHRIKVAAESILKARLGENFPPNGLGEDWVTRYITRHWEHLGSYWSRALDSSRGRAVNEVTKTEFFSLLNEVVKKGSIPDELIYGADESGIQTGIGQKEYVVGPKGAHIQHQERSGNRENITVLPTICADGTYIAPVVIFKGEAFQLTWLQSNPLKARLGYQKKGYTDGEIGAAYLEDFHLQTKNKANGRTRLLAVDGHNSHYTIQFLECARKHNIEVICYPAHSTHVYQGLDVVIFSVMKKRWSQLRDKYERDYGRVITKANFLEVYSVAHEESFTSLNIKRAFSLTGIVPFNPDVITASMMAPSIESSSSHTNILPIVLPTPSCAVVDAMQIYRHRKKPAEHADTEVNALDDTFQPSPTRQRLFDALEGSALTSFLVSDSTVRSSSTLPTFPHISISPMTVRQSTAALLAQVPSTILEEDLQNELKRCQTERDAFKLTTKQQQAQFVLCEMYVERVRGQLQFTEEKKKQKPGKIKMDGRAKILTDNEIYEAVQEHEKEKLLIQAAATTKKNGRQLYKDAMKGWEKYKVQRKVRNDMIDEQYNTEVKLWESDREQAKAVIGRTRTKKPVKPTKEKQVAKPKLKDFTTTTTSTESQSADMGGIELNEDEEGDLEADEYEPTAGADDDDNGIYENDDGEDGCSTTEEEEDI